jgi:Na+-transporting methylmalonyl-CoA/oxaloacetate decarboxylase gamma subunit
VLRSIDRSIDRSISPSVSLSVLLIIFVSFISRFSSSISSNQVLGSIPTPRPHPQTNKQTNKKKQSDGSSCPVPLGRLGQKWSRTQRDRHRKSRSGVLLELHRVQSVGVLYPFDKCQKTNYQVMDTHCS